MKPGGTTGASLAQRLRSVRVGLRADLEVSRHVFRGRPSYVVRDPLTFQSHQFSPEDYEVLVRIDASRTLGDIFGELVRETRATQQQEEAYYEFVFSLHRLGFLQLPVSDETLLYRRFAARRESRRRQRFRSLLFLQIPLWNPDAFLDRTQAPFRPLFTVWALAAWVVLAGAAVVVAASRGPELFQPLNGILATRNLPLMWVTLVVLKTIHEFGHAYACKRFGVHVPEMGAYLILGTPCAYVDATGSWSLPDKWKRIVICLAGMYFESIVAALAVFVWSATSPGLLNSVAYNVIFLASAVTVLFNISPLMRYDGYYILSDLLELPNLRARSLQSVREFVKRRILGVPLAKRSETSPGMSVFLLAFGAAAAVYMATVTLGIAAVLSFKLGWLGLAAGVLAVGSRAVSSLRSAVAYLCTAPETAPVRVRAASVGALLILGVPLGVVVLPMPVNVYAAAVVGREREQVLRLEASGFVESVHVAPGEAVRAGQPIARLSNDTLQDGILEARSRLEAAEIKRDALLTVDPAGSRQEQLRADAYARELRRRQEQIDALSLVGVDAGEVVQCLSEAEIGRLVPEGAPIATIVSGAWETRALLTQEQVAAAAPRVGDAVEFRAVGLTGRPLRGFVRRITPAGGRTVNLAPLTAQGGGDIIVRDGAGTTTAPYFELTIVLEPADVPLRCGMTGEVRFPGRPEPLGLTLLRKALQLVNRVLLT